MKLFGRPTFEKLSREEKIHFFINIGIGIAIVIILQFFEQTDFGEHTLNKAFDYIIKKEAMGSAKEGNLPLQKNKNITDQISFIDMGRVYQKKGAPVITPRDELAKVMEAAIKGKSKVILLDILLEDKDCCHPEHDRKLREVLQGMMKEEAPTKVIFPVRIGSDGKARKNIYEDLIIAHKNFYPAIPYLSATVSDRIVRYWVPYERLKDGGRYSLLWNASFLAAALAHGKEKEIETIGQESKDQKISRTYSIKLGDKKEIEISTDREDIYRNRIRFFLIPRDMFPQHPGGNLFERANEADEAEYANFKDKIVIIGNSDPDAGDIHLTPVGNMPGMYIIGNAINTILLGLQPSQPPILLNILVELGVVLIAALVLSKFPPLLIKILKGIVLISVLSGISYYYFLRTGVLLNFTFAVAAMGFHDTAMSIEKELTKKKWKKEGGEK